MPTLEITTSTEDRFAFAMSGGRVLATMLYPADSVTRERVSQIFGAVLNQYPGPDQLATPYQTATFETLSEGYTIRPKQWRSGMAAGRILRLVRQIATHSPESEASVLKAIHVLTGVHKILGKQMGRSVVRQAWSDFKSVSHLWVAVEQLLLSQRPKDDLQRMLDSHLAIIVASQLLISIAEEWRQFGETFRSRQKSPLLDPEETWAAPEGYDLTKGYPVIPPLDQDESRRLESYLAPAHY